MNSAELYRYIYDRRATVAIFVFLLTASISCGFFSRNGEEYFCGFGSIMLRVVLPLILVALGGLVKGGFLFAIGGTSVFGFLCGILTGNAFERSLAKGLLYLFFCGVPCNTVYILCFASVFIVAFDCCKLRHYLRRKGLKRPMNNYETRQYIAKIMLFFGIILVECALESLVFGAAYCKI